MRRCSVSVRHTVLGVKNVMNEAWRLRWINCKYVLWHLDPSLRIDHKISKYAIVLAN
jgi:hypothetical protein